VPIWFCRKLDSAIGSLASFCYDILISVEVTQWQARKGFTVGIFRSASSFKSFDSASITLNSIEIVHTLRKGQLATQDISVQSLAETFYSLGSIVELGKQGVTTGVK
jgi:hypothetical protein